MRLVSLVGVALLAWGLGTLALNKTDGFSIDKVGQVFIKDGPSTIDEALLQGPFYYLAKGGQSYVFLSQDGTRVLKLLRGSKRFPFAHVPPFVSVLRGRKKRPGSKEKIGRTLCSYAIAWDRLKEETGLLATHLGTGPQIASQLTIIDRCNIAHTIDPNSYPFVIQKRATLVKEAIAQLMEQGKVTAAKEALTSLFALLQLRIDRGIEDIDPNLAKNFGFIDCKPIQIDPGQFKVGTLPLSSRLEDSQIDLQQWINRCYPELAIDFRKAYENFLAKRP